jgi:AcrR family transcriptional regulator
MSTDTNTEFTERAERSGATAAAILEAARDLLAEGGVRALSMRGLAERVGVSATAIYHHFASNEDLVSRVVSNGYLRFGEYVQAAADRYPKGSLERLMGLGEGYVRFAFENQEYFRVLYSIQSRSPRELDDLPGGGGYHLLRQCVVDAVASGAIREADPDVVAHYLWTSVHGLVTLSLAYHLDAPECAAKASVHGSVVEMFRAFSHFMADGLRPRANGTAWPGLDPETPAIIDAANTQKVSDS